VNVNGRIPFQDNARFMVEDKDVLFLAVSETVDGAACRDQSASAAATARREKLQPFTATGQNFTMSTLVDYTDLPDYASFLLEVCPLCRKGIPLDAAVNSFGCSKA